MAVPEAIVGDNRCGNYELVTFGRIEDAHLAHEIAAVRSGTPPALEARAGLR
jgi:hypothetical protein